jgi:hypothetical protein
MPPMKTETDEPKHEKQNLRKVHERRLELIYLRTIVCGPEFVRWKHEIVETQNALSALN